MTDRQNIAFQKYKKAFDQAYHVDYTLRNGKKFYDFYLGSPDHPFYRTNKFSRGSLVVSGVVYRDQMLKYDVYEHELVLQHTGFDGMTEQIILTGAFIDAFSIRGDRFRKMAFPGTGTRYFQIIYEGDLSCYATWQKELDNTPASMEAAYSFYPEKRTLYLLKDGALVPVKTRSALARSISEEHKREIKRHMRKNRISLRHSPTDQIRQLIGYCDNLTKQ